jgi:hypothetical protein
MCVRGMNILDLDAPKAMERNYLNSIKRAKAKAKAKAKNRGAQHLYMAKMQNVL